MKLEVPVDVVSDLEIWKPIVGFEGRYEVSNHGRVKSLLRCRGTTERILRPRIRDHRFSYLSVCLYTRKHKQSIFIHRLVLATFVGPCPVGMECRHLDGNSVNNRLVNLCWGTPVENAADQRRHGVQAIGERHGRAKLTDDGVREIRGLLNQGLSICKIARLFGVHRKAIYLIKHDKTWKHVPLTSE